MCRTCWNERGSPAEDSPEIRRAMELVASIYETEHTGCPLHVALDDWNLEDQHWEPWGGPEDLNDPTKWNVAVELAELMKSLPLSARASALARLDGFILDDTERG